MGRFVPFPVLYRFGVCNQVNRNESSIGRLKRVYDYLQSIKANDHVLGIIKDGLKICSWSMKWDDLYHFLYCIGLVFVMEFYKDLFCLVFLSCPTSFSWLPYSQLEEFSFHLQNRQLGNGTNLPIHRPGKCGVVGHWRIDHQSGALSQRNNVEKISTNVDYIINIIDRKQSLKRVSSTWLPYSQIDEFSFHLQNCQLNYEFHTPSLSSIHFLIDLLILQVFVYVVICPDLHQ
jgi:hypothetical protein